MTDDTAKPAGGIPDAAAIRVLIAEMSHRARSAHFGSSLSCVEILNAVLAVSDIRPQTANDPGRDRLIVSKGHAAMACYAVMSAYGLIERERLEQYLSDGSALWGHVTLAPEVPAIDAATGSLGHGLGLALGFCLAYRLKQRPGRIFCVLSDGELDEGSTWEAALFAGARRCDRLAAIIDYNKVQSLDHVKAVMDLEPLADKWRAFGWDAAAVDGHDTAALMAALQKPQDGKPRVLIAHTVKGKGVPRIENTVGSHYHPATEDDIRVLRGSV